MLLAPGSNNNFALAQPTIRLVAIDDGLKEVDPARIRYIYRIPFRQSATFAMSSTARVRQPHRKSRNGCRGLLPISTLPSSA